MPVEQWINENLRLIAGALEYQRRQTAVWAYDHGLDVSLLDPKRRALSEMTLCPAWDSLGHPEGFEVVIGGATAEDSLTQDPGYEADHTYAAFS